MTTTKTGRVTSTDLALTERIRRAFDAAGPYLDACLAQRNPGPSALGSTFLLPETRDTLLETLWEPYTHPEVAAPAVAFKAGIPGYLGVVPLASLDMLTPVRLEDPKGTRFLEAVVELERGPRVDFTILLLGPSRSDPAVETLWTFFPGEPVSPSGLNAGPLTGGAKGRSDLTVAEAIMLGLRYAKVAKPAKV